jgi:anaerobic dimethyl sulfoxide reductase subunit C (anchor subunit)
MDIREIALTTFTILGQMAVGSFLVLGVVNFLVTRKAGVEEADRMTDRSWIAIVLVMGLALLASLPHLASPLKAPTAVTNIGTSWLSREILSGAVFFALAAVFAILQWFKVGPRVLRIVIGWLSALVGLVLVFSMSMVYYVLPTQPAWNNLATPISFFTTTLLLGSLATCAAFVANFAIVKKKHPESADLQIKVLHSSLRWIAVLAVVLLGVELVVTPLYLVSLATGVPQAVASAKLIAGPLGTMFLLRMILAFVGAGVFGFFLYQNAQKGEREKLLSTMAYVAFVLVLVAEVLGRLVFYSSHVGITL